MLKTLTEAKTCKLSGNQRCSHSLDHFILGNDLEVYTQKANIYSGAELELVLVLGLQTHLLSFPLTLSQAVWRINPMVV